MEHEVKIGLEIHQQLDTKKLFCECPSILRKDPPSLIIKRKLHAVPGETGEIDIAAEYETQKEREFIYQAYDTTCLVELDEEPPHPINQEALKIAIQIALLLNCKILPTAQIMRKTVVDGSNTSGFQRTVLIARDGHLETKYGKVKIENVCLEEDSARIISRENDKAVYRLDRLGIPLVEIGTTPEIKSPEQCREVALQIGEILRSCKVKRGIGTIRQDVNINIKGHPRVEIKGFQDMKMFIPVLKREIERQKENLKKRICKSEVRNALPNGETEFLRPMPGAARMYPETDLPLLKISKKFLDEVKKTLPRLISKLKEDLEKKGLNQEEIKSLLKEKRLEEFEAFLKILNDPKIVFKALIQIPKELAKHKKIPEEEVRKKITLDITETILQRISEKKLEKSDIKQIMENILEGKELEQALNIEKIDLTILEEEIAKLIKEKPGLTIGGYMGLIMQKYKGKINGKDASEILKKLLED